MGESKAICVAAFWWIAPYLWLLWQMSQHSVPKTILNVITPFRLIAEPATGPHHGHQNPSVIALHFGKQINYLSLFFVRLQFFRFFLTCPLSEDPWLMAVSSAKEGRSLFCVHCGFHFHFLFLCDTYTGPTPGCCCLSPHGPDRANYVIISFDYFVWLMLMGNSARKERRGMRSIPTMTFVFVPFCGTSGTTYCLPFGLFLSSWAVFWLISGSFSFWFSFSLSIWMQLHNNDERSFNWG